MKQFESKDIYLQWLYRRHAMPMGLNRTLVKVQWTAAVIFVLSYWGRRGGCVIYPWEIISGFMVAVVPVIFGLVYFLYYAPLAIETDSKSTLMQSIFTSPVPTSEVVSDLRIFFIRQHLVIVFPTLFVILMMILPDENWANNFLFPGQTGPLGLLSTFSFPVLVWWFILESGVASAGLPKIAHSNGLVFLFWVIPMFVLILAGCITLANWLVGYGGGWDVMPVNIWILVVAFITRGFSYRFMARKRSGYWGA